MIYRNTVVISIVIYLLFCLYSFALSAEVDTTKAVIHHTASHDVSVEEIDRWHKERGWDGIGYHYVIRKNGRVETGRSLWKQGAHAKGRNNQVGIALTGYDEFNDLQINSLKGLLSKLGVTSISRHHEQCPGPGITLSTLN